MTHRFTHAIAPSGTEIRLAGPQGPLPVDDWAVAVPAALVGAVDLARRLEAAGEALAADDTLLVEHRAVSRFTAREAGLFGLPALAPAVARIDTSGVLGTPGFKVDLGWRRPTGQAIVGAERTGAWLRIGREWWRLPDVLFDIAEAVDRLAKAEAGDIGARLAAIRDLTDLLPGAQQAGAAQAPGLIGSITIAVADAFSLDLKDEGGAARLVPILHRAGGEPDAPLLPPEQQAAFGDDQFHRFPDARTAYTLGRGTYVVLSPPLHRALAEVRRVQAGPAAGRRSLMASPRAYLRQALGPDTGETVLEGVFRETRAYADRVIGLGLWERRVLPWIQLAGTDWLGPEAGPPDAAPPGAGRGIVVGDRAIPLDPDAAEQLRARVVEAMRAGEASVRHGTDADVVAVPATQETLDALTQLEAVRRPRPAPEEKEAAPSQEALLIETNENIEGYQGEFTPRAGPRPGSPACLSTSMKPHQADGLDWLQKAWSRGLPGVLLADDMGLGKTLQALAFLAWLREGMAAGVIREREPLLVVAPTGLLENWRAEHDRHLAAPGLGGCVAAYGRGLAALKRIAPDGRPGLDADALAAADWVLTTYETLRDYDRDFGAVRFAVLLFDEAQKIKTPGIRLTDAAKAMNARFRVALTGTPIENRLADLWCITDTVHPALLGDLKGFSAEYERAPDPERLMHLKSTLDRWQGGRPPLLLRRLKRDHLPDLPACTENRREEAMPPAQHAAYAAAVAEARRADRPGAMLEALQRLRAVSLHPHGDEAADDEAFVAASARMRLAFAMLDAIEARGERALVFLDDLGIQARLATLIQRRYRLPAPPMIISGEVPGPARQARVDRFQVGSGGFDAMLLTPRAGGVGLTLTRANHVIHLSRWWNPAVEDQCTGRVFRIGQTRPVEVHIPIATLPDGRPSFDQNLHALLERKRRLMHDALVPPAATDDDRDELFRNSVQ